MGNYDTADIAMPRNESDKKDKVDKDFLWSCLHVIAHVTPHHNIR